MTDIRQRIAQAPRLHRVRIEGFRAIQHPLELDLRGPDGQALEEIVLAGVNGSGKTSALQAILVGLGLGALTERYTSKVTDIRPDRVQVPDTTHIELDVSFGNGPIETWVRKGRELKVHLAGEEFGPRKKLAVTYFSSARAPMLAGPVQPLVADDRPDRSERKRLQRFKQRLIDERSRKSFQRAGEAPARDHQWLARLNRAWARFHEDDGTRLDMDVVDSEDEDLYVDLYIFKGESRVCSIDEASSGELELISFFGTLVVQDEPYGLILIDEPELHLHPRWQASILPALREFAPEAQFVVATHADAPWDQAFTFQRFELTPHHGPDSERPATEAPQEQGPNDEVIPHEDETRDPTEAP